MNLICDISEPDVIKKARYKRALSSISSASHNHLATAFFWRTQRVLFVSVSSLQFAPEHRSSMTPAGLANHCEYTGYNNPALKEYPAHQAKRHAGGGRLG